MNTVTVENRGKCKFIFPAFKDEGSSKIASQRLTYILYPGQKVKVDRKAAERLQECNPGRVFILNDEIIADVPDIKSEVVSPLGAKLRKSKDSNPTKFEKESKESIAAKFDNQSKGSSS